MVALLAANLVMGAALVELTRGSEALRDSFWSWQLVALATFEAVWVTPTVTYLVRFEPAWAFLYQLDPQVRPYLFSLLGWMAAPAVGAQFAAALLGYAWARWGLVRGQTLQRLAPLVVGLGAWAAVTAVWRRELAYVGDFDTFWQGQPTLFLRARAGLLLASTYPAGVAWVSWLARRYAHRDPGLA